MLVLMWLVLLMVTRVGTGFVTLTPPELVVMEGDVAVFTCSPLYSVALPILERNGQVYHDPHRLSHTDHALNTPEGRRVYQLSDVHRRESGATLRCYMGGFFSNTLTLTVVVLPQLSGPSGPLTLIEGNHTPHTLHYSVTGFPHPHTLHWLLDGTLFTGNDRVGVVNTTTLKIQTPNRSDGGNYTLVAINTAGQASLSLLLRVVYNEFLESPVDITMPTGGVVRLRCVHRFGWAYSWFSSHIPLYEHTDKVVIEDGGSTLLYGPVDYTDHDLSVHCVVHVDGTDQVYTSPQATLTIPSPPVVHAPPPMIVREGSDVLLQFVVYGHPPPSHTQYLHNGNTLTSSRAGVEGVGSLNLTNVTRFDDGNYTLIVSNDLGHASNTSHLTVLYAPVIVPISQPIISQVFKPVSLPCGLGYHSNPPPVVSWMSVLGDLSSDPRFSSEGGALSLSRSTYSDEGVYVCTVSNSLGNRSTHVTLLVLDPPTQPVNVMLVSIGPVWAEVTWDRPHSNGSRPVTGYIVTATPTANFLIGDINMPLLGDCVEVICEAVEVWTDKTTVNVTGLVPGVEYVMHVTALASVLQSVPSEQLTLITNNSVPSVVDVTAVVNGWGASLVSWRLAYSGGSPVTHYHIQFRRANDSYWRNITAPISHLSEFDILANIAHIPSGQRSWQVHGLESSIFYHFRVRGVSVEGVGAYSETELPMLSHENGVPCRPSQPSITCWTLDGVCVHSEVCEEGLDVLILVFVSGQLHSSHMHTNYTTDEIILTNVSYHGDLTVQVVTANGVGVSEPSQQSLPAREFIVEMPAVPEAVGLGLGICMGLIDSVVMVISMVICTRLCWEVSRQKRSLAKRVEIAQTSASPISPRWVFLGNLRESPDTPSNNEQVTGPRRSDHMTVRMTPPTPLSSVSLV